MARTAPPAAPDSRPPALSVRERLEVLFDPPGFHETFQFTRHAALLPGRMPPAGSADPLVSGRGLVAGRPAYAAAHVGDYLEGTQGWIQARTICGIMDLALKARAPFVWISGAGARDRHALSALLPDYARVFHYNALLSGAVPQIALITGPSAGAGFVPSLADFVIVCDGTDRLDLAASEMLAAGDGGESGMRALEEADVHLRVADDRAGLLAARRLVSYLPVPEGGAPGPAGEAAADDGFLQNLQPARARYDMLELLLRIADRDTLFEIQGEYAPNLITAFARFDGEAAGIVANQPKSADGAITPAAADKASRFVRFCNTYGVPLLSVVDVPGFGQSPLQGGVSSMTRHAARMLFAFSSATVPKITVIVGRAHGGAYLAMGARSLGADRVAAWPGAELTLVPPDRELGGVLRRDTDPLRAASDRHAAAGGRATAYSAAAAGVVDAVIDPSRTRPNIVAALRALSASRPARVHHIHAVPSRPMPAGRAATVPF
jgi:acetyl-CoA carboxylase carboxyltransferase component